LAHSFPPSRARSLAFATFAAGAPVGAAFGTTIGGVLTEFTTYVCFFLFFCSVSLYDIAADVEGTFSTNSKTWRSSFYLLAGLTMLCFIGGVVSIDEDVPSNEVDKRVDWIGAFLVTAGLVLIVFVLGEGEYAPQQWRTPCTSLFS
jgi:predicted MFS family arabinose efflux permease